LHSTRQKSGFITMAKAMELFPLYPSAPAPPHPLGLRFLGAVLLAVLAHLLFFGILAGVVEMAMPASAPEIQAFIETEAKATPAKVSRPMATEAPVTGPPPPSLDFSVQGRQAQPSPQVPSSIGMQVGHATQIFTGGGGMGMPLAMRSRGRLSDRIKSLTDKGGSPEAEDAVQRALRWLANVQNKDGSWGSSYPVAMSGYAVLCFLGHGDTPDSATYGPVVRRGVEFLTQTSAKNTGLMASKPGTNGACYEHGIATYALGEVYAMARFGQKNMGLVIESFEKGVQIILRGQTEAGGWLYNYNPGAKGDLSVTGWQYQALKAARQTRLDFPTLEAQIQKTERFLLHMRGPRGGFGYNTPGDKASLTGVGVLGLQMFNPQDNRMAIVEGLQLILDSYGRKKWPGADLYAWYYNTQATFNFGGAAWDRWNAIFQKELLKNQKPEGNWSHSSASKAKSDANIYGTVLCTLMLEVYYRYEPSLMR